MRGRSYVHSKEVTLKQIFLESVAVVAASLLSW